MVNAQTDIKELIHEAEEAIQKNDEEAIKEYLLIFQQNIEIDIFNPNLQNPINDIYVRCLHRATKLGILLDLDRELYRDGMALTLSNPTLYNVFTGFYKVLSNVSSENIKESILILKKAAADEDDGAMVLLGVIYWMGMGVEVNKPDGIYWLKKAALFNNRVALFNLGYLYYNKGDCTNEEHELAIEAFSKSCNLGMKKACLVIE